MTQGSVMPPLLDPEMSAAASQLADCLQARGYRTTLIQPTAGPARIKVTNPQATALTETIIIHSGAYWWPWRDQIATHADPPAAADIIARVLAARP
jgi:hypothetical protein